MFNISNISKFCFGCEQLGGTDWGEINVSDITSAIHRSLDSGVNFFDTAPVYGLGLSETRLSEILGSKRHDLFIATKGGLSWSDSKLDGRAVVSRDSSKSHLRIGLENSLRRLKLDFIPIYYIHWPDPNVEIRYTFEILSKFQSEGKIMHIGCSNFNELQLRAACEVSDISLVQLPINLLGDSINSKIADFVKDRSIGLVAYNVLANGLLTGKYDKNSRFEFSDRRSRLPQFQGEMFLESLRQVEKISLKATINNMKCSQFSISQVLKFPNVVSVIVGIKNLEQLEENISVLSLI